MEIITDSLPPFTNLIDMEDLTKKGSKGISASSESEDHPNIAYRPVEDFDKVIDILCPFFAIKKHLPFYLSAHIFGFILPFYKHDPENALH